LAHARVAKGIKVLTMAETRWARCDIKSVSLLPNVLAKQAARSVGAYEAWFVDADGLVTEGSSSNAWIVTEAGVIVTRDLNANILAGITRAHLLRVAEALQMRVEERAFTVEEAKASREAFMSSATNAALPVVQIDETAIGNGKPGPVAQALHSQYLLVP
jgi:D-alanine transaminase